MFYFFLTGTMGLGRQLIKLFGSSTVLNPNIPPERRKNESILAIQKQGTEW
jgi:hypothetical protein